MKATQHCTTPLAQRFTAAGLLRFAAPSIGMMLVISLYSVTDGIFIGRYAGASALAASNIVYPAINLLYGLAIMLASGGSALVAKTLGEGQPLLARQRFTWITAATFTIGAVFALFLWAFFSPALAFLGASPEMLPDCRAYLGVLLPFFPIAAVSILFDTFCIADGRAGLGFLVAVASGVTNAALDYLFLAHMELGILGAGLATGLADLLAATLGFVFFLRFSRTLRFTRFTAELSVLASAASNGISEMVTQCSVGITTFLFNLITFAWAGEDGVAAICVILYAEMLLTSFLVGFSNGVAPVFSYHYGAKHDGELLHLLKCALTILAIAGIGAYVTAQVLAAPLVALFLPQGGSVAALTETGFRLFSLSFLLCGFNLFTSGFFTALSDGRTSALCSFARNLAGIVIFLLVLPHFLGLTGVWLAVPTADLTAVLFSSFCLFGAAKSMVFRCQRKFPKVFRKYREAYDNVN